MFKILRQDVGPKVKVVDGSLCFKKCKLVQCAVMGLLQSLPGVVAVITAEDIPGINDFTAEAGTEAEEVSFFALLNFLLMIYFDV